MHRLVISQALAVIGGLELAHVLELPAIRLMALQAGVHAQSAAGLRGELRRVRCVARLLLLLLRVCRSLRTHHSRRQVARSAVGVEAAGCALRTNYHVARALRLRVLLLHALFLHRLLLKMRMHLRNLLARLLRNRPVVVPLAEGLSRIVRGIRYMMLLLMHLLFHVVIITGIDILNVDYVLVLLIFSVFVGSEQIAIARIYTHHATTTTCVHFVIDGNFFKFGSRLFAASGQRALVVSLSVVGCMPLLLLEIIHVGRNILCNIRSGARPLLTSRIAVAIHGGNVGFELRNCEMSRQVESLVASLVLLREQLLTILIEVFGDRQVAHDFSWVRLLGRGSLVRSGPRCLRCLNHVRYLVVLIVQLLQHFLARQIEPRSALAEHLRATLYHLLDWLVGILRLEGLLKVSSV